MKRLLTAAVCCMCVAGCDNGEKPAEEMTPDAMYARVQELLKPGVENPDTAEAVRWLIRAADAGHLQAQTDLGGLYLEGGKGVAPDAAEAFRRFSSAAEQGSAEAHAFLGNMLRRGIGTERDAAAAAEHWRIAAEKGIADAAYHLGMYLLSEDNDTAAGLEWLRRAARSGNTAAAAKAAYALGLIYARGEVGEARDMAQAAEWYAAAATGGDARAQHIYGLMLITGEGTGRDEERGMTMLRMSAGQDYPAAIAELVRRLRNAPDAEAHETEAAAWAERLEKLRR